MNATELKAARAALGLTQQQLADAIRISNNRTIRAWESGSVPIPGPAQVLIEIMVDRVKAGE